MRRYEREVTDEARIDEIIEKCSICRLGLYDGKEVYIVPMNFGFINNAGKRSLFFHSATEGRKVDIIKKSSSVGFEMDCSYEPVFSETACGHSSKYQSVIGSGTIQILKTADEKKSGLLELMKHVTGNKEWTIPTAAMKNLLVFRVDIDEISCKEHQ